MSREPKVKKIDYKIWVTIERRIEYEDGSEVYEDTDIPERIGMIYESSVRR